MKQAFLFIAALLVTVPLLGCAPKEPEEPIAEPPASEQPADPLTEARAKLFQELGLDESGNTSLTQKSDETLPVVLPTPPELPKTDE